MVQERLMTSAAALTSSRETVPTLYDTPVNMIIHEEKRCAVSLHDTSGVDPTALPAGGRREEWVRSEIEC